MKFSMGQDVLAKGIGVVSHAVGHRSNLPVLGNILLAAEAATAETPARLRLAATNLEIAETVWLDAMIEEEGSVTLPAQLFSAWVASVASGETIEGELVVRTMALHLAAGRSQVQIKGIDAAEFPLLPMPDTKLTPHELPVGELARLIELTAFAAAGPKDTSRPALTGVVWDVKESNLTLAATDGYRLSVVTHPLGAETPAVTAVIPAAALQEVARLCGLADPAGPVKLWLAPSANQLMVSLRGDPAKATFQEVVLLAQLIDAKFPDYNAIIPKTEALRLQADGATLAHLLKQAGLFARDASDRIVITVVALPEDVPAVTTEPGVATKLAIYAISAEAGEHNGDMDVTVIGVPPLEIACNARYLQQVVAIMGSGQLQIDFTTATRPLMFTASGETLQFKHIIMPMQLTR